MYIIYYYIYIILYVYYIYTYITIHWIPQTSSPILSPWQLTQAAGWIDRIAVQHQLGQDRCAQLHLNKA